MRHIIHFLFATIFVVSSCTDKFEDYNTDPKHPASVSGESLFTNAEKSLTDQISSTNVNENIFKLMSQYWTETTYVEEANYDLLNRNIPKNIYTNYYRAALADFKEAARIINETEVIASAKAIKQNKLHIIEILNVYSFQRLVDIFGMIPYSASLNIENVYPKYEKGEDIYKDLFIRLDAALKGLDKTAASFGSADLFYGGDVKKWSKFGNALKIKLAITIADYDNKTAKEKIESAVANAFSSADDNCLLAYQSSSPNQNPLYESLVASGRNDFVPANTLVNAMHGLNDPRLYTYFTSPVAFEFRNDKKTKAPKDTLITEDNMKGISLILPDGTVEFRKAPCTISPKTDKDVKWIKGGNYGYSSPYGSNSHVAPCIEDPTFNGILMTYSEQMFYLAEAAARGYSLPKTAEEYYNEGIKASFDFWKTGNYDTYIKRADVAYSTAKGTWKQKIAIQSWLASYTRGLVGYNTWRRLDYPTFNVPELVDSYDDIPMRFTFPVNEQTLNATQYNIAADVIGRDLKSTKVFWDKF